MASCLKLCVLACLFHSVSDVECASTFVNVESQNTKYCLCWAGARQAWRERAPAGLCVVSEMFGRVVGEVSGHNLTPGCNVP